MRKYQQDEDRSRTFFYCPVGGTRRVYFLDTNGSRDDWPEDVFQASVADGIFDENGRLVEAVGT